MRRFAESRKTTEEMSRSRNDGRPKNHPSKRVESKVDFSMVSWLQEPGSFGGHKPKKGGHRMVSGIVRAKEKE